MVCFFHSFVLSFFCPFSSSFPHSFPFIPSTVPLFFPNRSFLVFSLVCGWFGLGKGFRVPAAHLHPNICIVCGRRRATSVFKTSCRPSHPTATFPFATPTFPWVNSEINLKTFSRDSIVYERVLE